MLLHSILRRQLPIHIINMHSLSASKSQSLSRLLLSDLSYLQLQDNDSRFILIDFYLIFMLFQNDGFQVKCLSIIIVMQLTEQNLTLLKQGCNSDIILWTESETKVVIKTVSDSHPKETKHLHNQWTILSKLSHQNLVEVYRHAKSVTLPNKTGKFALLAQEYAEFGNLMEFMRKQPMNICEKRMIFWEIAQALRHLHSNCIVHRDLKLENILVAEHEAGVTAKIADFGFATRLLQDDNRLGAYKGTRRGYMAPQIHQCKNDSSLLYDAKASDMFALGVVLFSLVLGRLPFQYGMATDRLYGLLVTGKEVEFWATHSVALCKLQNEQLGLCEQFKQLFIDLVTIDAQKRLTIEQVLQHPWVVASKIRPQSI